MALGSQLASSARGIPRTRFTMLTGERSRLLWLIPFGVAAAYIAVFIVQLSHTLWVLNWNADYVSDFTIPTTTAATGTGGDTILGTSGGWFLLWIGMLTATLPLHHELWELAPIALFVGSAALVGWSVAQVADRLTGVLAALLIAVASPRALYFFIAPIPRLTTYLGTALLGAYLVWLASREHRKLVTTLAVAILGGVLLGTFIASDSLLIATGATPFAITAVLAALRRDRRSRLIAGSALTTVVVAVPVAKLTSSMMASLGYVTLAPPTTQTASLSTLPRHAELMWEGLKGLFNGYLSQTTNSGLQPILGVACEVMMVAALAGVLVVGVYVTVKFVVSGLRRDGQATPTQLARSMHVIFWAGSAGAISVAWALSTRTEYAHESYYAILLFSVAAIVVLLIRSRSPARWVISLGASIFFTASIVGLTSHYMESFVLPIERSHQPQGFVRTIADYETQIVTFAEANHVLVGYAGYGDAPPLTWRSHERILVRPVQLCNNPNGVDVCPFFLARVPSWYAPQERRTFLLVDTEEAFLPSLPEGLGNPIAYHTFGPTQMYVYPYDIASRMHAP